MGRTWCYESIAMQALYQKSPEMQNTGKYFVLFSSLIRIKCVKVNCILAIFGRVAFISLVLRLNTFQFKKGRKREENQ